MKDDFFIGWRDGGSRRGFLAASLALGAVAAGAGAWLASNRPPPGPGAWDQSDVREWTGVLQRDPYPALLWTDAAGAPHTAFLATTGKLGVTRFLPRDLTGGVRVRASLIARGDAKMLAIDPATDWIKPASAEPAPWVEADLGPALLAGEILDAKCWFGAMRPGYGKAHKSCAALCAEGGLPLAFCETGACRDAHAPALLFVGARGQAHDARIHPLIADPVLARGRLVRVGDVTQFRVDPGAITRL